MKLSTFKAPNFGPTQFFYSTVNSRRSFCNVSKLNICTRTLWWNSQFCLFAFVAMELFKYWITIINNKQIVCEKLWINSKKKNRMSVGEDETIEGSFHDWNGWWVTTWDKFILMMLLFQSFYLIKCLLHKIRQHESVFFLKVGHCMKEEWEEMVGDRWVKKRLERRWNEVSFLKRVQKESISCWTRERLIR